MKQVVATGPELSMDERNVLSVAYKNKADDWFVDCDLLPFYMDMVWFDMICMWVDVDGLWLWRDLFMQLCNSFLTCMCAQTHLQVHRNFAQMQLVLVLMVDNLWGCSCLIKLSSHPLHAEASGHTMFYTYTIWKKFKRVAVEAVKNPRSGWHAAKCLSCH